MKSEGWLAIAGSCLAISVTMHVVSWSYSSGLEYRLATDKLTQFEQKWGIERNEIFCRGATWGNDIACSGVMRDKDKPLSPSVTTRYRCTYEKCEFECK